MGVSKSNEHKIFTTYYDRLSVGMGGHIFYGRQYVW